jgi:hypothetical protein
MEALKTLDQAEAGVPNDPHIPYVRAMILGCVAQFVGD